MRRFIQRFIKNRRGAFAMQFALMIVPMVACTGLAIDGGRAFLQRFELGSALDAAALACGSNPSTDTTVLTAMAQKYLDVNFRSAPAGSVAVTVTSETDGLMLHGSITMPTFFMPVMGVPNVQISANSEVKRGGSDLEIALILDTTGSMAGTKITNLQTAAVNLVNTVVNDVQTPHYSKLALVTYSMGVNANTYAASLRGAVTPATAITAATWRNGAANALSGISKASQVVVTSNAHTFANGDYIYISGVGGMTQINSTIFMVSDVLPNSFKLKNPSSGAYINTSSGYSTYTSGGTAQKCFTISCEVQISSLSHGLATNDYVSITGVSGMTQINTSGSSSWQVSAATTNTFILSGTTGPSYSAYTSGGTASCLKLNCPNYRFTNPYGSINIFPISNCVTERTGTHAYDDLSPSTAPLGLNYPASTNPCPPNNVLIPLSTDKTTINAAINNLTAAGSTSGQVGIAWGWYALSPNFAYLWPTASQPAAYNTANLVKVAVLMTDGSFNSPYCNGVIAADAISGSGNTSDHINCNATNGNAYTQALQYCTNMKAAGITVYTVGFDLANTPDPATSTALMTNCATDQGHAYLAATGAQLQTAFAQIAKSISLLRLAS